MPKRRNPFGDCSPLQFKQHVGIKEIDTGIAQKQNMKSVFEKTKALLFNGAKKSLEMPMDANCNNIYSEEMLQMHSDVTMEDEDSSTAVQMQISSSGQLIVNRNPKPKNAFEALMKGHASGKSRGSCHCCKGQAASQSRCGFCEKSVCPDCVRTCCVCDGLFCQLCSVMNYEDIGERSFCLSCSS